MLISYLTSVWVTLQLAALTTVLLLLCGLPLAWWLTRTRSALKPLLETITALPLVLPPTVLGFYLLVLFGANGPVGEWWQRLFGHPLAFTFSGIVVASCIYSLPFVVQPLQTAFAAVNPRTVEAAWTLGASRSRTFFRVVLPQAGRGVLVASVLGFAHTVGEFGVVLMVGGNIPGQTQVVAISIYDMVEAMDYASAHAYAFALLMFSLVVLFTVYSIQHRRGAGGAG